MARFRYTAFSGDGRRDEGTIEFGTESQAWESLTAQGLTVVDIAPIEAKSPNRIFSGLLSNKIPLGVQADVAEQMAVLFGAHMQATEIVSVIAQVAENRLVRRCFEKMMHLLADGGTFAMAFEQAAAGFEPLFLAMVRVSETLSDPTPVLKSLAAHLRRQQKLQAQLSGALVYPFILLCGGIAVFLLVVLYLAPALAPMFESLGKDVPSSLGTFISIGAGLKAFGLELASLFTLLVVLILAFGRRNRLHVKVSLLRVPIIGQLLRDSALARLTRALNLMLQAGLPLAPSLADTASNLTDDLFADTFREAANAVEHGNSAFSVFELNKTLPLEFRELFNIGERTNSLSAITGSLAVALEDRVERRSQQAVQLITPLLTLIMGGGLALLVYSIMDAILSVNDLAF
jgi:general secretion pathway protein F